MMKRILLCLLFSLAIVSCSGYKEQAESSIKREISFSTMMAGYSTKAVDSSFEESDAIGLSVLEPVNESNIKLVMAGGKVIPEKKLYWGEHQADTEPSVFQAYYPYAVGLDYSLGFDFFVQADQHTHALFTMSDFMSAHAESSPGDGPVCLHFSHLMSKLVLVIDNQLEEEIEDVFVGGVQGRVFVREGAAPTSHGKRGSIKACKVSLAEGGVAYTLVIAPQEASPKMMITTANEKQYTLEFSGAELFTSGKRYTAHITLNANMAYSDFTTEVTDWTDNSDTQFADESGPEPPEDLVIQFTDDSFKMACIANGVDANGDGEIKMSEAAQTYKLDVRGMGIRSVSDVSYFTELRDFNCGSNQLTGDIDLTGLYKLEKFECYSNEISGIIYPSEPKLKNLNCRDNQFSELDLSPLVNLTALDCSQNKLTSLVVSGLPLETLRCNDNLLSELDLTGMDNLKQLACENNMIKWLQLMGNTPKLSSLTCEGNQMTFIDLYDDRDYWTLGYAGVGNQRIRRGEELYWQDGMTYIYLNPLRQLNGVTHSRSYTLGDNVRIVTEEGFMASIPESVFLDGNGGIQTLTICSHTAWNVITYPDWTTIVRNGPYDIQISVSPNNTGMPRFSTIVARAEDGQELSVPVSQGKAETVQPDWTRSFYHRSLVQHFSWDGCPLDPQCDAHLSELKSEMGDRVEIVTLPLTVDATTELLSLYGINEYPTRILAGIIPIVGIKNTLTDKSNLLLQESIYGTYSGMALESSLQGRELTVHLKLYTIQPASYVVTGLLLEDGVVSPQAGAGDDYVHNNMVREQLTEICGFPVYAEDAHQIRTYAFRFTIPDGYDADKMRVVFYVRRKTRDGGIVINDGVKAFGYYADNVLSVPLNGQRPLRYATDSEYGNEDLNNGESIVW